MIVMSLPDLLSEHIDQLRSQGYTIDVIEQQQEIGIVFHNYLIPDSIWSRDLVDLLVIAHPSYPNPKMDMFWVDPTITLKNGTQPNAANTSESKFGRTWQRFSWHVSSWNPAHDNLITYLEVVNHRLRQNE